LIIVDFSGAEPLPCQSPERLLVVSYNPAVSFFGITILQEILRGFELGATSAPEVPGGAWSMSKYSQTHAK
jgi:hypothetical protein